MASGDSTQPETIGPYKLRETIGEGGIGVVATHLPTPHLSRNRVRGGFSSGPQRQRDEPGRSGILTGLLSDIASPSEGSAGPEDSRYPPWSYSRSALERMSPPFQL
jgi:hypothetical protein